MKIQILCSHERTDHADARRPAPQPTRGLGLLCLVRRLTTCFCFSQHHCEVGTRIIFTSMRKWGSEKLMPPASSSHQAGICLLTVMPKPAEAPGAPQEEQPAPHTAHRPFLVGPLLTEGPCSDPHPSAPSHSVPSFPSERPVPGRFLRASSLSPSSPVAGHPAVSITVSGALFTARCNIFGFYWGCDPLRDPSQARDDS